MWTHSGIGSLFMTTMNTVGRAATKAIIQTVTITLTARSSVEQNFARSGKLKK